MQSPSALTRIAVMADTLRAGAFRTLTADLQSLASR